MDSSQLLRIEKKLDRILEESNDLRLRMSLLEQRLTIFDARLDRLEVRMDRIEQGVEQIGKVPAHEDAVARPASVNSDHLPRSTQAPPDHGPRPVPTQNKERDQENNWFEQHLQQQLEEDRRYRSENSQPAQHRAFTRFDRG